MTKTTRRPITAVTYGGPEEDGGFSTSGIAVICDDGSFFTYSFRDGEWFRNRAIPGTPGEAEAEALEAAERDAANARMLAALDKAVAKQKQRR